MWMKNNWGKLQPITGKPLSTARTPPQLSPDNPSFFVKGGTQPTKGDRRTSKQGDNPFLPPSIAGVLVIFDRRGKPKAGKTPLFDPIPQALAPQLYPPNPGPGHMQTSSPSLPHPRKPASQELNHPSFLHQLHSRRGQPQASGGTRRSGR